MREEGHAKVEAEVGAVQLQTHQGWMLLASTRSWGEAREDTTQSLRESTALLTP